MIIVSCFIVFSSLVYHSLFHYVALRTMKCIGDNETPVICKHD